MEYSGPQKKQLPDKLKENITVFRHGRVSLMRTAAADTCPHFLIILSEGHMHTQPRGQRLNPEAPLRTAHMTLGLGEGKCAN